MQSVTLSHHCQFSCSLIALSPEDVLPAVYLCTNRIAADHENMVSFHVLMKLFNCLEKVNNVFNFWFYLHICHFFIFYFIFADVP